MSKISTSELQARAQLSTARRVVVKVGTRVLSRSNGRPDRNRIGELVDDLAAIRNDGKEVILVTSGAIGAGIEALGIRHRPTQLEKLQLAAAVGQCRLMSIYDHFFRKKAVNIGQVLLIHDDLADRRRHLNAQRTILTLLEHNILPIINENDVVSAEEIRFGDNDVLASRVALLVRADALIYLTKIDSLRARHASGRTKRVSYLSAITPEALGWVLDKKDLLTRGGMLSKLQSANDFLAMGGHVAIAPGRRNGVLQDLFQQKSIGTVIGENVGLNAKLKGRKRWLAFFHNVRGQLVVDSGACHALLSGGRSLLPVGIKDVVGNFPARSVVLIRSVCGELVGRGLVELSSSQIRQARGKKTAEIKRLLGDDIPVEVIHRDNLVFEDATKTKSAK